MTDDVAESLTTASLAHSELLTATAAILLAHERRFARLRLAVWALGVWSVAMTVAVWGMAG